MSQFTAQPKDNREALKRQAMQALNAGRFADGVALLQQVLALEPGSAGVCGDLARAYWRLNDPAKAEEYFQKACAFAPEDPYHMNGYGVFLMGQERLEEALPLLERAYALKPGHHEVANNLGLLHHRRGDWTVAETYFKDAIRAQPSWPAAHGNLATLLRDMGRNEDAEISYREALRLAPANEAGWRTLGDFYRSTGRYEEAVRILKRFTAQAPFNEAGWMQIAEMQETMTRLDDARATVQEIKSRFPQSVGARVMEAKLLRREKRADEALGMLKELGDLPESSPHYLSWLFELGQLYERAGDADKAFDYFLRAKQKQAQSPEAKAFDRDQYINSTHRLLTGFTPAIAENIRNAPQKEGPAPIFLVGFPRSGTTLLDQILSSHPQVLVAEEKPILGHLIIYLGRRFGGKPPADLPLGGARGWLADNACYPGCIAHITDKDAAEMRRLFYQAHGVNPGDGKFFVDKLPLNIRHAALIRRVFPRAKFILALRHPCDSVLSCFMQQFELNPGMMPFLDIHSSARLYDEVFKLWDAYAQALPLDVHKIRYEDVVADQRGATAGLLDFLGLPWNDAVLDFDKTARERHINTPSYHQVTEKIYTRASGRWLRYRAQLEPVLPLLAPHALKHGYSME